MCVLCMTTSALQGQRRYSWRLLGDMHVGGCHEGCHELVTGNPFKCTATARIIYQKLLGPFASLSALPQPFQELCASSALMMQILCPQQLPRTIVFTVRHLKGPLFRITAAHTCSCGQWFSTLWRRLPLRAHVACEACALIWCCHICESII